MGTLYWQLNDCWPAASWSGIDYYGSWKALHYYVKKAYEPIILAFIPNQDSIVISICSDNSDASKVQLYYAIKDFEGNTLDEKVVPSQLDPLRSIIAARIEKSTILGKYNAREIYLEASILKESKELTRDIYFFEDAKDLHLPAAKIQSETTRSKDHYMVTLTSDKLARNVYLSLDECDAQFSDNYFNLLPGEKKTVQCKICDSKEKDGREVKIKVLNDLLDFNN